MTLLRIVGEPEITSVAEINGDPALAAGVAVWPVGGADEPAYYLRMCIRTDLIDDQDVVDGISEHVAGMLHRLVEHGPDPATWEPTAGLAYESVLRVTELPTHDRRDHR